MKWSAERIAMIGAQSLRFPTKEQRPEMHWESLRASPPKTRALVAEIETKMSAIESDPMVSHEGKRQMLRELGRKMLPELNALGETAPSVQRRLAALETAMAKELQ